MPFARQPLPENRLDCPTRGDNRAHEHALLPPHHIHRRRQHGQRHRRRPAAPGPCGQRHSDRRALGRAARASGAAIPRRDAVRCRGRGPQTLGPRGLGREAADLQGRRPGRRPSPGRRAAPQRGGGHYQRKHGRLAGHATHRARHAQHARARGPGHDRPVRARRRLGRRPRAGRARGAHHGRAGLGGHRARPRCRDRDLRLGPGLRLLLPRSHARRGRAHGPAGRDGAATGHRHLRRRFHIGATLERAAAGAARARHVQGRHHLRGADGDGRGGDEGFVRGGAAGRAETRRGIGPRIRQVSHVLRGTSRA